jgi:hypothetical protein
MKASAIMSPDKSISYDWKGSFHKQGVRICIDMAV